MMTTQERALWIAVKELQRRATVVGGGMPPSAHASNHASDGTDPVTITTLDGYPNNSPAVQFLREDGQWAIPSIGSLSEIEPHGITVDGGGAVVTTGVKGRWRCPFDYDIVKWSLLADQSGNVQFDIKVGSFGGSLTSIVASAPPSLSSADQDDDAALSGWTTTGSAGTEFEFSITGTPASITRATLVLDMERV